MIRKHLTAFRQKDWLFKVCFAWLIMFAIAVTVMAPLFVLLVSTVAMTVFSIVTVVSNFDEGELDD